MTEKAISHKKSGLLIMALGALGVVYGDIGTSPLYAVNEMFFGGEHLTVDKLNVLGAISLIFWALTLIISIKYIVFVLRADNQGEGGVFALFGLLHKNKKKFALIVSGLLMFGAGLLYGDGIITPAISVLSAVEGLKIATTSLEPYIIPITVVILTLLFLVQSKGTAKIGAFFGPILTIWFISIAVLGLSHIIPNPEILEAVNPWYAYHFIAYHDFTTVLLILGSVMLSITGGEAMYADMGHFGRSPIRFSWFVLVYPSLLLCYFGQGGFLLSGQPVLNNHLFFSMVPSWGLIPMVMLATIATVIASQALISGAFSLTSQAVALGIYPRIPIVHTHKEHEGQIYVPIVNWALYAGSVALVLGFQTSTRLASAYGLAVSGVMLITTLAMILIATSYWKWKPWKAFALFGIFCFVDGSFLFANTLKVFRGGYVPLIIGLGLFAIMKVWMWGRAHINEAFATYPTLSIKEVYSAKNEIQVSACSRRSVVFMTPRSIMSVEDKVPALFQLFMEVTACIPQHVMFLTVVIKKYPYVTERFEIRTLHQDDQGRSIIGVTLFFGFMEDPNVEAVLDEMAAHNQVITDEHQKNWIIYILQERILPALNGSLMHRLQFAFFRTLQRNSDTADHYFGLGNDVRLSVEVLPVRFKE